MKLRKLLAILLVLALSLGVAPVTGASGQSTTFQSKGTVTPEMMRASSSEPSDDVLQPDENGKYPDTEIKTIEVKVTNIYAIQVNPYGMTIKKPDDSGTDKSSIVTVPMYIENDTNVQVEVTARATAVPYGDVALDSKPTRYAYEHFPHENPKDVPSEERVYLYMQMTSDLDRTDEPNFPREVFDTNIITKNGGAGPLRVSIDSGEKAALQIFGNTSIPTYYGSWPLGNGFNVYIVLSFTAKQTYTVTFDAVDVFWEMFEDEPLAYNVYFLADGITKMLPKGYVSSGTYLDDPDDDDKNMTIVATQDLTFTIRTAEKAEGSCYTIRRVTLSVNGVPDTLYDWEEKRDLNDANRVTFSHTIDASKLNSGDRVDIRVVLDPVVLN